MKVIIQFEKKTLLFQQPQFIIYCDNPSSFAACFRNIEQALSDGYYLAGFLSYEAGYCFEEKLQETKTYDFPLICLGVYDKPIQAVIPLKNQSPSGTIQDLRIKIARERYFSHIRAIREYIAKGDVYQVTYCIKLSFVFHGDPFYLYSALLNAQPVPYPAYIETERFKILSLSPEKFMKKIGSHIITKPMKGTWSRGLNPASDLLARMRFQYDVKNRAENVMIADLLRNDLGRVGTGIRVPKLFEVTKYKTLYQMTSTVTGCLNRNISMYALFSALFPSGSVTGAPKIRAMEIIRELEGEERKIYTGAIGYIAPNKDLFFNVPIRTLLIRDGYGEMGVGGGIVWDSSPQGEWDEGLLKAAFLRRV